MSSLVVLKRTLELRKAQEIKDYGDANQKGWSLISVADVQKYSMTTTVYNQILNSCNNDISEIFENAMKNKTNVGREF